MRFETKFDRDACMDQVTAARRIAGELCMVLEIEPPKPDDLIDLYILRLLEAAVDRIKDLES